MNNKEKQLNNMRLIDANKLLKEVRENKELFEKERVYLEGLLLNAETYNQVGHKMATAEGFCTNPEWNKGEWIITNETDEFYGRVYKCAHCGKDMLACGCRNFCGYCGADLRGDKE